MVKFRLMRDDKGGSVKGEQHLDTETLKIFAGPGIVLEGTSRSSLLISASGGTSSENDIPAYMGRHPALIPADCPAVLEIVVPANHISSTNVVNFTLETTNSLLEIGPRIPYIVARGERTFTISLEIANASSNPETLWVNYTIVG
jgi:hypothetical protein